jgi:hypothetical protein
MIHQKIDLVMMVYMSTSFCKRINMMTHPEKYNFEMANDETFTNVVYTVRMDSYNLFTDTFKGVIASVDGTFRENVQVKKLYIDGHCEGYHEIISVP